MITFCRPYTISELEKHLTDIGFSYYELFYDSPGKYEILFTLDYYEIIKADSCVKKMSQLLSGNFER
ncbi:hypothetical protein IWQ60_004484 [Tieghemiomyces parasiticus]|uniref:Uncharacterized protein n=1 Tax=Tieghemiomyces parasiticus TaxID=78921 RepID=A0A9W8DVH5_9FUNG|nr:hypothetical protein IWQ60_004484 [Tieghemiomyces parasiticus]